MGLAVRATFQLQSIQLLFGLATFDFVLVNGTPHVTNLAIIGGETPGRQTVPRAELFGAIGRITRVHINVCARIGVGAAYVTNGVFNRLRFEKEQTGIDGESFSQCRT